MRDESSSTRVPGGMRRRSTTRCCAARTVVGARNATFAAEWSGWEGVRERWASHGVAQRRGRRHRDAALCKRRVHTAGAAGVQLGCAKEGRHGRGRGTMRTCRLLSTARKAARIAASVLPKPTSPQTRLCDE
eukprot:scaffold118715_cov31-Tisochrysis_lutea.AAC.5